MWLMKREFPTPIQYCTKFLHSIIYQWHIDLEDKEEEKLVSGIANGLTTVFVDNIELMDYLKTKIKEG